MVEGIGHGQNGGRKVFFVGTYPPRNCGIATFTHDLSHALSGVNGKVSYRVAAITNIPEGYDYPEEVSFEIHQNQIHDYRLAADYVNFSGADIVCLQHEFGIFGGAAGTYINHFLSNLKKPVVTTLHTVLKEPNETFRQALLSIAELSLGLVVMSRQAIQLLTEVYGIERDKIFFIHHGIPDTPFVDPNFYKDRFQVEGRFVLLTFGLLNPNKGIELVLEALPLVAEKYPKVAYIILGATHPEVKRLRGEEYRLSLQRKVTKLGLESHVFFYNRFVDLQELCEFIGACDLYITPYRSREQITSGTLAYALGMGKPVISTPYWYAQEMLAEERGILVDFGDVEGMANAILEMIENEPKRHQMRKRAYEFGRTMVWREVGKEYLRVFETVLSRVHKIPTRRAFEQTFTQQDALPEVTLDHLCRLTDDTGLIQHATYGIPDRRHGYSTDDAGRALVVVLQFYDQYREQRALELAERYLSFLAYAQREDGRFHGFMDYQRKFIDEVGSEDTQGRALWGLGCAVSLGPHDPFRALAKELFERAIQNLHLNHPRSLAYAIFGFWYFLQRYEGATAIRRGLIAFSDRLVEAYEANREKDWRWFHGALTYGNAKIPQALLLAYHLTGTARYREVGLESLDFLTQELFNGDYFDLVGNSRWYERGHPKATFSQQPIDAGYLTEAYATAYRLTQKEEYLRLAQAAFEWFLGRNRLGLSLYDFSRGACFDGIDPHGINQNQGAESIICFLLANLALSQKGMLRTLIKRPFGLDSGLSLHLPSSEQAGERGG
ncbi:MAG: glycosyltransferase family 4 protein [Desulfobacterota bacterium]|nr:glycosyltransferase family 4 protein [Thermodesulfobacteriota bacterium]